MIFSTYILRCADATYYVGCTNNLEKRVREHNTSKKGAHYTKMRRPVILLYKEEYPTLLEARGREAALKRLMRKQKEKLIEQH